MDRYRFLKTFLFLATLIFPALGINAQEQDTLPKPWEITSGLGADVTQLLQINPKVGAGENRFGLGWAISSTAKYQKDRLAWDNTLAWSFGIQKLGSGLVLTGDGKVPFQKSIDELRLGSKVGYKFAEDSKFFYAADFSFLSQLTKTYQGNYLIDIEEPDIDNDPISRLFSPAQLTFSIGIDLKPDKHLSIFLSPVGYKAIIVASDAIADDVVRNDAGEIIGSVHGNPVETSDDKLTLLSFNNAQHNIGSLLRASYTNKFLKDKIAFKSGLVLYSNYLQDTGKIDVEWTTETAFQVIGGLQISLLTTLFYDYDVFSYRTNYKLPQGIESTPERDLISFTEQFLIKYNVVF